MNRLSDWATALLDERRYAVLGTQDDDGAPHLTPVWYLFRDGQLFIDAESFSRKVRNIRSRPNVSFVVDHREPGLERWVSGLGPATIIEGAESQALNADIFERYLTAEALSDPRVGQAFAGANDVTVCVRPERWRAWSGPELDAKFFGGILTAEPARWFRAVDD